MTSNLTPTQEQTSIPGVGGLHHIGLTVCDIEASEAWYTRFLGLDKHEANQGQRFDESRTGLDHVAFHVADRSELDAWIEHFDRQGVAHSSIAEFSEPFPFA